MNKELMEALEILEKEKNISKATMLEAIENSLITACKNHFGRADNIKVNINPDTGDFAVLAEKTVAEEVEDPLTQISLAEAKMIKPTYEIGDVVQIPVESKSFGRIATQTAKQVIIQGIREAERGMVADEFASKEHEILNGTVTRIDPRYGTVILELGTGREKTEAILPAAEQVKNETIREGQRLKVYLVEVRRGVKGPQMIISRTHPGLVKRLFELEVPEIHDGTVLINSIAREAGSRTKIAVSSTDENVDPIGACVGPRGSRVAGIVEELQGEKIDIIKYSDDPVQFVAEALSPADVLLVTPIADGKSCSVVVPDDQLSLAIGKEGQNARLAAKLTGWKIDIKPQSQALEKALADAAAVAEETEE